MIHSRAAPSVRGIITAQSFLTQGEIPEEGRKSKKKTVGYYMLYIDWNFLTCLDTVPYFSYFTESLLFSKDKYGNFYCT